MIAHLLKERVSWKKKISVNKSLEISVIKEIQVLPNERDERDHGKLLTLHSIFFLFFFILLSWNLSFDRIGNVPSLLMWTVTSPFWTIKHVLPHCSSPAWANDKSKRNKTGLNLLLQVRLCWYHSDSLVLSLSSPWSLASVGLAWGRCRRPCHREKAMAPYSDNTCLLRTMSVAIIGCLKPLLINTYEYSWDDVILDYSFCFVFDVCCWCLFVLASIYVLVRVECGQVGYMAVFYTWKCLYLRTRKERKREKTKN